MLTITLSGPAVLRKQLDAALAGTGATVLETADTATRREIARGLPDTTAGKDDTAMGFVTVEHEDLNTVVDAAQKAKWSLRSHHITPTPTADAPEGSFVMVDKAKLDEIVATVRRLEKGARR